MEVEGIDNESEQKLVTGEEVSMWGQGVQDAPVTDYYARKPPPRVVIVYLKLLVSALIHVEVHSQSYVFILSIFESFTFV
ncbi:hypothetical protein V6N11_070574 [Hibiscus sabdariffa]|uniref:Transmembrane protein n=1 Tax=Hibiscus sabdariffa TaxID=183260 RepID=A0ABR2QFW9_9ROSI